MEHSKDDKELDNWEIINLLNEYILSGKVKSIQKLRQNRYRILINDMKVSSSQFSELKSYLNKNGYKIEVTVDRSRSYYLRSMRPFRDVSVGYRRKQHLKSNIVGFSVPPKLSASNRYIIVRKVAAPPLPKDPDDFGELK